MTTLNNWQQPQDTDKKNDDKKRNENKNPWGENSNELGFDDILKKVQNFINKASSNNKKSNNDSGNSNRNFNFFNKKIIFVLGLVAVFIWLASGFYIVNAGEQAVVLRFGLYNKTVLEGPHWHIPFPVEKRYVIDVKKVRNAEIGFRTNPARNTTFVGDEALMLTEDENIIDVKAEAQYQINDLQKYLFMLTDPDETLRSSVQSSLREVVGKNTMDFIVGSGRNSVGDQVLMLSQKILDSYNSGLLITAINLVDAQPPEQVQGAFADAVKAQSDKERKINEAQAYSNDILPKARGAAARQTEDAQAYKQMVISRAKGEAERFNNIWQSYKLAPQVTRERLYIEAVENVISKSSKIMLSSQNGNNNLLMLPLDQIIQKYGIGGTSNKNIISPSPLSNNSNTSTSNTQQNTNNSSIRDSIRSRTMTR